jgi:uncharacterized membrane protein YdbT with pleckstrin-like domain
MATQAPTLTYRCPHCGQPVEVDVRPESELLLCPNPNCQKPFKVEVPTAQPAPELVPPATNGVNGQGAAAPAAATPPAIPAPPAARPPEVKEETVQIVDLAMFRRYPLRILAYLIVVVGGTVGAVLWGMHGYILPTLICAGLGGWGLVRFVLWTWRMKRTDLIITNKRCIVESGLFTRNTSDIPLSDLREVQVIQPFFRRLFDVGDLMLMAKHGGAGKSILVMAVPHPEEVARRIRDLRPL